MNATVPPSDHRKRAQRARSDGWTHEEFLAACLEREVAARAANQLRIRAARFPARKSLDDFDFDHQRSVRRDVVALDFITAKDNVVFLGPPGLVDTARSFHTAVANSPGLARSPWIRRPFRCRG